VTNSQIAEIRKGDSLIDSKTGRVWRALGDARPEFPARTASPTYQVMLESPSGVVIVRLTYRYVDSEFRRIEE